mgnify:CR=1 FL=1
MTVTVSDYYVVGCEMCCTEIERITRAAVRDFTVTKLSFTPGHRHNHEEAKSPTLAQRPSASALEAVGQQSLPGTLEGNLTNKPAPMYTEEA